MDTQFDDLSEPDFNTEYICSESNTKSSNFTHLMKLVICVKKFPNVITLIKKILDDNPNEVNKRNTHSWTPLMLACRNALTHSSNRVVSLLINYGANVNDRCYGTLTPLYFAAVYADIETVKLLINAGANIDTFIDLNNTIVMCLFNCKNDSTELIKFFIDCGADVNIQNSRGQTCLMLAMSSIKYNNIEMLQYLINAGADLNKQTPTGNTALMLASVNSHDYTIDTLKLLINAGTNVNIQNNNGETALMIMLNNYTLDLSNVDFLMNLIILSKNSLTLKSNKHGLTANDIYVNKKHTVLDEYQLMILKADIMINNTKSANKLISN